MQRVRTSTKERLLHIALDLFSTRGYGNVGIREISAAAHIKPASVYTHYPSKDAFLADIFQYFYDHYWIGKIETRDVLRAISTKSPHAVLEMLLMPPDEGEAFETMRKVMSVAVMEYANDSRAADLVSELVFAATEKLSLILNRMIEVGKIEPIDVDMFVFNYVATSLSGVILRGGQHAVTFERWKSGRRFMLSMIKEKRA